MYTWTERFTYEGYVRSEARQGRYELAPIGKTSQWWSRAVVGGEIAVYALMVCSSTSHSIRSGSK